MNGIALFQNIKTPDVSKGDMGPLRSLHDCNMEQS